ncbi:hypothetical protein FUAX_18000 [Fulvitalea axinellae]|uniref:Photosynthesis system II assembly factor Ycf48/Hcf136-like domain-containing protein n=1 Tax=Fulvitalea axinellae TaxID=1182444 RepID=A0AAU9D082_9BACT|nr:hypothetical protein FUAX_18000 [Fulvitalea axinellae]
MNKFNFNHLLLFIATVIVGVGCDKCDDTDPQDPDDGKKQMFVTSAMTTDTQMTLKSVFFVNERLGYATGGDPLMYPKSRCVILKTVDGGENWNTVWDKTYDHPGVIAESVYATSEDDVFVAYSNAAIFRSGDAGASWEKVCDYSHKKSRLTGIAFSDANNGMAVGNLSNGTEGYILTTSDGGEHWDDPLDPHWRKSSTESNVLKEAVKNNPFSSINFFHGNQMEVTTYLTGGLLNRGVVTSHQKSSDQWNVMEPNNPTAPRFEDLAVEYKFIVAVGSNGVISGNNEKGAMYASKDGAGAQWLPIDYGADNKLKAVGLKNNTIVAVGWNKANNLTKPEFVTVSLDKGDTWQRIQHDHVTAGWEDVFMVSDKKIFMVGSKGLIMKLEINAGS